MTLVVGAALSFGGMTDALDQVHFLVQKDLDRVEVIRQSASGEKVVASVASAFAGNSLYKLAWIVPDTLVSQKSTLFDASWMERELTGKSAGEPRLTIIDDRVREEFFKTLPFGDLIHEKAAKYDVDPALVAAVVEAESRFKQRARSPKGAQGLMQLMPRTALWMGARNAYDPEQNVDAGVKYLKYLEKRFDGNRRQMIAAYNAGEGTVKRYGGVPPYGETRTYVRRVMSNYERRSKELKDFHAAAAIAIPLAGEDEGLGK